MATPKASRLSTCGSKSGSALLAPVPVELSEMPFDFKTSPLMLKKLPNVRGGFIQSLQGLRITEWSM
jgi:hypothetical protein